MRRALSSIFGRFFARWYLRTHQGFSFFFPIDRSPQPISRRLVIQRTGNVFLPDWVCARPGYLCIGEAKGSTANGNFTIETAAPLRKARTQIENAQVWVQRTMPLRFEMCQIKGWAVMSRWATEDRPDYDPLLYALDPETRGIPLNPGEAEALAKDVEKAHYRVLLEGLGKPHIAHQVQDLGAPDRAFVDHFGQPTSYDPVFPILPAKARTEAVILKDPRFQGLPFIGAIVDAGGRVIDHTVEELTNGTYSLPPDISRQLFFVGVDQSVIEDEISGAAVAGRRPAEFVDSSGTGTSRPSLLSYKKDGFGIVPLEGVDHVEQIRSGIIRT
jgi:hypothetical protein